MRIRLQNEWLARDYILGGNLFYLHTDRVLNGSHHFLVGDSREIFLFYFYDEVVIYQL